MLAPVHNRYISYLYIYIYTYTCTSIIVAGPTIVIVITRHISCVDKLTFSVSTESAAVLVIIPDETRGPMTQLQYLGAAG